MLGAPSSQVQHRVNLSSQPRPTNSCWASAPLRRAPIAAGTGEACIRLLAQVPAYPQAEAVAAALRRSPARQRADGPPTSLHPARSLAPAPRGPVAPLWADVSCSWQREAGALRLSGMRICRRPSRCIRFFCLLLSLDVRRLLAPWRPGSSAPSTPASPGRPRGASPCQGVAILPPAERPPAAKDGHLL